MVAVRGSVTREVCVSVILEQPSLYRMLPELLAPQQPLHSNVPLLAGGRQLLMGEGKQETGLCKEIAQVGAEAVLQKPPQWQDVSIRGCPVCQKVLHNVMDGIWPGQRPVRGTESHLTLCWEVFVIVNNRM